MAGVQRVINLQLFAEERQHPATPRRRQEARRRGQVFRSLELSSALILAGGLLALQLAGDHIWSRTSALFHRALGDWARREITADQALELGMAAGSVFASAVLPVMLSLLVVGLAVNVAQVGPVLSTEPLSPRLSRINPVEGFKRIFSRRAAFEFVKSLLKVTLVAAVTYGAFRKAVQGVVALTGAEVGTLAGAVGRYALSMSWQAALALVAVAGLDYLYQRYEYEQSLKMTRQELKEELREAEGDPHLRARIRRRQRELASMRMLQEVRRADVVITNPTHYAVALRYDPATMAAPVCCAKGKGHLALRIREIARQYGVTWVEDRFLARSLYQSVDVGEAVPEALYEAVAEVLAFVWRLRNRKLSDLTGGPGRDDA